MAQHLSVVSDKSVGFFVTGLAVTSLVLMASLAWNTAFQSLFDAVFPKQKIRGVKSLPLRFVFNSLDFLRFERLPQVLSDFSKDMGCS